MRELEIAVNDIDALKPAVERAVEALKRGEAAHVTIKYVPPLAPGEPAYVYIAREGGKARVVVEATGPARSWYQLTEGLRDDEMVRLETVEKSLSCCGVTARVKVYAEDMGDYVENKSEVEFVYPLDEGRLPDIVSRMLEKAYTYAELEADDAIRVVRVA